MTCLILNIVFPIVITLLAVIGVGGASNAH